METRAFVILVISITVVFDVFYFGKVYELYKIRQEHARELELRNRNKQIRVTTTTIPSSKLVNASHCLYLDEPAYEVITCGTDSTALWW